MCCWIQRCSSQSKYTLKNIHKRWVNNSQSSKAFNCILTLSVWTISESIPLIIDHTVFYKNELTVMMGYFSLNLSMVFWNWKSKGFVCSGYSAVKTSTWLSDFICLPLQLQVESLENIPAVLNPYVSSTTQLLGDAWTCW